MKKEKIFLAASMALNILLMIGTATFFAACGPKEDGSFMHCHTACKMVQLVCGVMTFMNLAGCFVKLSKVRKAILLIQVIAAVVTMLIPGKIISLCMMPQMHCRMMMRPFVLVMEIFLLLTAAVGLFLSGRGKTHE